MSEDQTYVGIDVSKEQLDIAVEPGGTQWSEANDPEGIGRLVSELKPLEPALVTQLHQMSHPRRQVPEGPKPSGGHPPLRPAFPVGC